MAVTTKDIKAKDNEPDIETLRKAAAMISKDPLALDRENARLFAADPANRSFEAQLYNDKIARGEATPREELLAVRYEQRARSEEAGKLAPELEDAAKRQALVENFESASGTPEEKAFTANEEAMKEAGIDPDETEKNIKTNKKTARKLTAGDRPTSKKSARKKTK